MYDLIGDIHGHSDHLEQLLCKLGYQRSQGVYRHPERQVIFLGDFIDRGPKIRQVLETVRPMIDEGAALAVMGNHELNALAYHTEKPGSPGEFLRPHTPKNEKQIWQTVTQLNPGELREALEWFRTLPLWLDLPGLRAVHACWCEPAISVVAPELERHQGITPEFLHSACGEGGKLFAPVETVLKGKEVPLPVGVSFQDRDGHARTRTRIRWYLSPKGHSYRSYALTDEIASDRPLESAVADAAEPYPSDAKPVFFGHYWLAPNRPQPLARNVACLDYSVAKGGFLCAYRWNGEQELDRNNFVWTT